MHSSDSIWFATLNDAERREICDVPRQAAFAAPDLLVLGSGIVGLATAYFAAERGMGVQVVTDWSLLGTDAELSLGLIDPNVCRWRFSPTTQQLAQSSRDWWAKLAVRPEFQIDWRVTGALMVDAERLAPHPRQHMLAALEEGYSVHDVDAEQVALLEPALSPLPLGGLHYPSEAVLHPLKAACGFIKGLRRRGGQISMVDPVLKPQISGGRLTAIETSAGLIQPRCVVIEHPRWLNDQFAPSPPFEKTPHCFFSTLPLPPLLKRPVLGSHWIVQLKTGEVVIEMPLIGNEKDLTSEFRRRTRQLIPALDDVDWTRSWSGGNLRSASREPVSAKHSGLENVWYCGGFDFAQVLFAPIFGKSLVDGL